MSEGRADMTRDQEEAPAPFRCPRCGGLMYKPSGSTFYWHTDNNHPRCDITNITIIEASTKEASKVPKKKKR